MEVRGRPQSGVLDQLRRGSSSLSFVAIKTDVTVRQLAVSFSSGEDEVDNNWWVAPDWSGVVRISA